MFGIQNFEAFIVASIMLNLLPGPDNFYILGRSLAQGRNVGIASALGISAGAIFHTLAAAIGLSALIVASPTAFLTVKLLGAAYLVFLGGKMFLNSWKSIDDIKSLSGSSFSAAFRQGLVTNAFNPKVALFFLAFLPQFIAKDVESNFFGFIVLGFTFVATSTIWGFLLAYSSAAISKKLRDNPKYLEYINKITGTLLIGLGVRLVVNR